ncbi:MAG: lysophospholipase [Thermoguttaceae bacterium]|nr:lysophospholipase [Thermoguttaceae bacterium]
MTQAVSAKELSFVKENRFFLSDAFSLYVHQWYGDLPPKGIVFFVHGMVEHSGRYEEWGRFLARHGFDVYAIDQRGHGRSDGARLWMHRFTDLVDDFCAFVQKGAAQFPDLPVFIAGMSMGGGVAIRSTLVLQERVPNFAGTILIAAAIRTNPYLYPVLRFMAPLFNILIPRIRILKPGIGGLAVSKKVRDEFRNDPYVCRDRMTVRFGWENVKALKVNRRCAAKITVPTLICQGAADMIVYPPGAEEFCQDLAASDKTLKLYPDFGHDLLHEEGGEVAWNDILDWLNRQTSKVK